MTTKLGFWMRQLDKFGEWLDRQSRFVAALTFSFVFMVSLGVILLGLYLFGAILWAIGGTFGLVVGVIFLGVFAFFYNILGNAL